MATRRRIGVSIATTEAARRQLMQPVPCWEKMWVSPVDAPSGSTFKVYKWVKTDKKQNFSDDEDEADEPLAPLPDEPETNDVDEDDNDDPATSVGADATSRAASRAVSEPVAPHDEPAPARNKPHPLSISMSLDNADSPTPAPEGDDGLGTQLKPLEEPSVGLTGGASSLQVPTSLDDGGLASLDMTDLGPDGQAFETTGDLSQIQATDVLLGGEAMDESNDPFTTK